MTIFFAWRYLRSKKTTNAINIIAWISMVAIGVVTAALVVVLSVFNGFEDMVKQLYGDFYSDLLVTPAKGRVMQMPAARLEKMALLPGIMQVEPVYEERAILVDQEDKSIVWLKGVSPDYASVSGVGRHIIRGEFATGDSVAPALVLGTGIENALQIIAGQAPFPVTIYLPNPDAGPNADALTAMLSANAAPVGSFAIQQEFDEQYAFTSIDFVRYMLGAGIDQSTSLEVFCKSERQIASAKKELAAMLGPDFVVKDRFQQNQSLFAAMQTEKLIIYAVAFLILIIAGFNIISSLTMTVLEKQQDLAVLRALGATDSTIANIFLVLGLLLAGIGASVGFVLGLLISLGQQHFHWVKLAGNSFLIDYYPVSVRIFDLTAIAVIVVIIAVFASWLPARRAAAAYYSLR